MKQVRGPPAARWLDSIKQWPQEVLKVGVCGSPHPGNSLRPMPALSLCVSLSTPPPSSVLLLFPLPFSLSPSLPFVFPSPLLLPLHYVQQSKAQEPRP